MPKPFYSMEEVCQMLGKTPAQIRALVADGTLREFRDAGKVFFKAEDVEKLSPRAPASLSDTSDIVLEAAEEPAESARPPKKEDLSALTGTAGGTSVIGLEPIEEESPPPGEGEKEEGTVITASGIGVFDDDELEIDADPMAKTQITTGAIDDQVSLESSGSGSGLLDLTRESDDTSLGAELLDEIYPGEEEAAEAEEPAQEAPPPAEQPAVAVALAEAGVGEVLAPATVSVTDPYEGLFCGFLVAAVILLGLAGSVVGGALQGYLPDYAKWLTDNFWVSLAGAGVVLVLSVVIGMFLGRAFTPRRG